MTLLTQLQKDLISDLRKYADDSRHPLINNIGESEGILSALVNLVDTARDFPEMFTERPQGKRERVIVDFLLSHNPN